jgi:crotonobetainyl-CoA:carnitine CoA-transferase CaiB-like acyl-CoA transferase
MARVVDLAGLAGAYGARLLVEAGHEIIRVEPRAGDHLRRMGPFAGEANLERGAYHQYLNAGKRSLTLDLASADGKAVLGRLAASADVVYATTPLPVTAEELSAANPRLIVTVVEDEDPELLLSARSGMLSLVGRPGRPPMMLGGHTVYSLPGMYAATATLLALVRRGRSQQGEVVTVSVRQCVESMLEQAMIEYTFTGVGTERRGSRGTITATSGALPCKDGYWLLSLIHRDEGWKTLMDWMQDPVLLADPSLAKEENRHKQRDFIMDRIEQWAGQYNRVELVSGAQERHIPASPISTPADLVDDPQLIARGFLKEVDTPEFGPVRLPVGPVATVRGSSIGPAPRLGQHNAAILEELGFSPAEQATLVSSGAV